MAWTVLVAVLGVFLAIPMKRQMINIEQLPFPSGIAAAQTLRSLYAKGEAASRKAKSLGIAAAFGGIGGVSERKHSLLVAGLPEVAGDDRISR